MTTLVGSVGATKKAWQWITIGGALLLLWAGIALPNVMRSQLATNANAYRAAQESLPTINKPLHLYAYKTTDASVSPESPAIDRRIIRTSSLSMVVERPAEVADKITALAEALGGYVVSAEGGGQDAAYGTLTVRVPSDKFEEAHAQIRKLGLRIESEKLDAEDMTRQYVDQDASIRNLRAEEAQYLTILKQATTVKDMLAVSGKLSEVRAQIEQQQAEFNALSRQIETVALAVSLRKQSEAQVFGLNWRPLYQLKVALRDGLEAIGIYAAAMTMIMFYLPAALMWLGTILIASAGSWRLLRWVGGLWLGWKPAHAESRN